MNDNLPLGVPVTESENARLHAIIREQEDQLKRLADLVAHVRHGLNNPLTGVLGEAQLLLRMDLPPKVRARVESLEQSALRLRDVTALLRQIQRPSANSSES